MSKAVGANSYLESSRQRCGLHSCHHDVCESRSLQLIKLTARRIGHSSTGYSNHVVSDLYSGHAMCVVSRPTQADGLAPDIDPAAVFPPAYQVPSNHALMLEASLQIMTRISHPQPPASSIGRRGVALTLGHARSIKCTVCSQFMLYSPSWMRQDFGERFIRTTTKQRMVLPDSRQRLSAVQAWCTEHCILTSLHV